MITKTLSKIGLTKKEIDIYLTLLSSTISLKTNLPVSTIQFTCKKLKQKKLITIVQKGRTTVYTAKPPQEIINILNKQKTEIENKKRKVQNIMHDLLLLQTNNPHTPKIQYFEGVDGIIEMLNDVLKEKKTINALFKLEKQENINPKLWDYFQNQYIPKRKKLKIKALSIFNNTLETRKYREQDSKMNRITLILPTEDFPFDACCHIYGNKVAFYSYHKNDQTGVIIDNSLIAKTQFSVFKAAWEYAKTLYVNKQYKDIELNTK